MILIIQGIFKSETLLSTLNMLDFSDCCKTLILNVEGDNRNYINKVAGVKNGYPTWHRHIPWNPTFSDNFIYFDKSFGGWVIAGEEPYGPYFISDSPEPTESIECPEFVESWDNGPYLGWEPKIVGGKLKCDSLI